MYSRRLGGAVDKNISQELIEAGRGYERLFVPALFEPWTRHLVESAGIQEGAHVLDVACGTGVLTRAALAQTGPGGVVVGVDPAPGMLAVASEIEPNVEWLQGSAEALDLESERFDSVLSQFGAMFFDDHGKASEEMHRVLKPGGSLAVAVWDLVEHNPAYAAVIAILEEQVGVAAADALRLPFSLGDPGGFIDALTGSGFEGITVDTRSETARFPSAYHMVEAELRGWLPLFDIFLAEERIESVLAESDKRLAAYTQSNGEAVFPTTAHVISARKA